MFDHTLLAENIKKHRLANRLTQTQLAEMTNVSCQAISKWERGIAIPELDKLCLLADAFHCTVDQLIGNVQTGQKMLMGVDGGGSKTEFVLFDEEGTIHETLVLSACNPNAIGLEGSVEILVQGIEHMKAICPNLQGVFIGSAGFKSGGNGQKINAILSKKYPHIKIKCDTDIVNVFASARPQGACIAGICGTGTVVYLLEDGVYSQYTGWGYLLDPMGSGFHIGRDAVVAALEHREGLGEPTALTELVEKKLGMSVRDSIRTFYEKGQSYIASFARCVFEAFETGDRKAAEILENNAHRLAFVMSRIVEEHPSAKTVILSGGVITENSIFLKLIRTHLDPRLEIILPTLSQAQGACLLCADLCGLDTDKVYKAFQNQTK